MPDLDMTGVVDEFLRRNGEFADRQDVAALTQMPSRRTIILGCVDPRVDPAIVLGVQLGEAIVIRNIGGRMTPATLRTMALLGMIPQLEGAGPVTARSTKTTPPPVLGHRRRSCVALTTSAWLARVPVGWRAAGAELDFQAVEEGPQAELEAVLG